MALSAPVDSIRLYAINREMPVREPYTITFDLSKYIDFPLIISDSEFTGNSGANYIQLSPSENDLSIVNQYSLSFNDIYSRYNEAIPFTLPGDNTDNITAEYLNTRKYGIPNPSIRYPGGASGGIVGYTYGKNGPSYGDVSQKMFFVVTPSGRISPGIVVNSTIDICVYGNMGDGAYYWETDYVYPLKKVTGLKLSPSIPHISKDGEIQFTLEAEFEDGSVEDVTNKANWGLGTNTGDEPVSELLGFSITSEGLLTVNSPESNTIVVSGKYGDLAQYTTATYSSYGDGSDGGVGGTGQNIGPGGSWGNGIGPSPSTDVTGAVPNGSAESNSSSIGLFTRYAMNSSDLFTLGSALYVENILANVGKEIMSFLWNSPNEALISLISYPFDVASIINTTSSSIKFGSLELDAVTGNRLNGTFAQINWGTIQLSEYWGNFLDYAPHTKIELYLPWCTGSVSIDPHEVLPGSISVKTNIEISKGTCVHNVFGNKGALIGTYSGTCGSQLPMTALDTSGKALALVTAAAGALVAGAAAGGGASAGIAAANSPHTTAMAYSLENSRGLDPMAARVTAQREAIAMAEAPYRAIERRATQASLVSSVAAFRTPATIQRNGSFTGNGAGMAIQFPFVIVSRPEQNIPKNYGRFFGYPSNVYATIGSVSGYTEIGSVHVNGLTGATLDEVEEVERLLKGGVIL